MSAIIFRGSPFVLDVPLQLLEIRMRNYGQRPSIPHLLPYNQPLSVQLADQVTLVFLDRKPGDGNYVRVPSPFQSRSVTILQIHRVVFLGRSLVAEDERKRGNG